MQTNAASRPAQKRLAYEVTKIVHGEERAKSVERISEALFGASGYSALDDGDFKQLESELAHVAVGEHDSLLDFMVEAKLASSKSEARRFLEAGAISINGSQLPIDQMQFTEHDFIGSYAVVKRGKNTVALAVKK